MKHKLRFLMMTLLCAVFSTAWGETPTEIATATFNGKNATYTEGWTTTGTGNGRTDCIIIGKDENITSPSFNLSNYSKIKISIKARRYGSLSGGKATIDVSIAGTSVGTVDASSTSATTQLDDIEFTPTTSMTAATLVFTCTNATSPGSSHGAGINSIKITGITDAGETVEMPTFSPTAGKYTEAQTVSISCATSGASIYYTIDGTTPSASSTEYSTSITISETTTLKAIAIKDGVSSSVASATYTIEKPTEGTLIASGEFNGKEEKYPEGWSTTGTGKTRTDCIIIGKDENITSPTFDFSHYSKIIITIKARRSGTLSGSKATIGASINDNLVGTTDATTTNANTELTTIEFYPTSSMTDAVLVFTCINATSAGSTHGAGINSITISGVEGDPIGVDAPTFSVNEGTYTEAQTVSISCATSGASIYYTIDGTTPSASSTEYSTSIIISETTTLKAIAIKDGVSSSVASATYTIETPATPITVAAARTQTTGSSVYTKGIVTSVNGKTAYIQDNTAGICVYGNSDLTFAVGDEITVQGTLDSYKGLLEIKNPVCTVLSNGNTVEPTIKQISEISNDIQGILVRIENATVTEISGQNTTIQQGESTIIVYGISGVEYAVGDIISLTGNVGCFNTVQIANPRDITVTTDLTPSIVINPTSYNVDWQEKTDVIPVTCNNIDESLDLQFYDEDGETEIEFDEDWLYIEINEDNNIEYIIEENNGEARSVYLKVYSGEVYSDLITITQAAAPEPAVTVSETSLELTAAESEGTINVTYTRTTPYELLFLDADGESSKEYDWIEAELDNDGNIYYLVDENTGEARSAYLKVLVLADADELLESNLITITQAAPVSDYATLTFEFDRGKADIENTSGLTQVGLSSDYSSSPKLKFDGTGDYVILHFNERPGTLTFDIKGYTFSEGEFVVQTSEDGTSYTDLKVYNDDNFGNTLYNEEFNNLGENVRYIKWVYKNKVNGNVGLGNIKLEKYALDPELTISDVNTTINTDETLEISTLSEGEIEFDIENDDVCSISKQGDVYWLFAASAGTTTVTATQAAFGEYKSASVTFTVTVIDPEAKTHVYKKVTNTKDITSGRYLIVYEGSKVAFDGSLETLDAAENITDVEINNGVITLDEDKDVFYFNIDVNAGTIKSAYGYYIGGKTEYSNGLLTSDTDTYSGQTFIIDQESNAVITATNNTTLRYNKASDQLRFRYYKPGQQPIQLYKFDGFTFNISDKATDGTYYYATISNLGEGNFKVEGNVTVRTVCVDEGELTDLSVFEEGDVLPGNGAYLVDGAVYGDYAFPATEEACEETDLGENMLISTGEKGLSKDEMIAAAQAHYNNTQGEYKFYKLSLNKGSDIGSVGFYWGNSNGEAFQYKKGHQAFLAVPLTEEGTGSQVAAYLFNGDKTGIYNVIAKENNNDATYSISGIRVENKQLPKGIYIKNGKKVVVK